MCTNMGHLGGWLAGLQNLLVYVKYGVGIELIKQLHLPVCALADTGQRLNQTLNWLAHTEV